ncbi:cysteine protease ATG4 like protein [Verticillium longisporum]|uniref:Cysteine protease n=1 Tax=Verticillium longisporum TaxID=100787 RepID=A0A8I2ZQ46_VERLO|nr:cysteine protease ATG4 like protein [Verticillium longisporum]
MAVLDLGRDWRRGVAAEKERQLLSKFADDPKAPYSIHRFVQHGAVACGKYPGEWFGPSATARCIKALMPQSIGIAGGRPSSSHYFIGAQGSFLFYLDPHHTRTALPYHQDPTLYAQADVDSVHTRRLRRLHVREMDPSMLIGFVIHDEDDWDEWKLNVKHVQGKAVIHVADYDPVHHGAAGGRAGAIDEVELLSDDDEGTVSGA